VHVRLQFSCDPKVHATVGECNTKLFSQISRAPQTIQRRKGAWRPRRFTRFNDVTNSIDLTRFFLTILDMKRLLVEILIIVAVIAFGWNTPFKDWTSQAYRNITNWFDSLAR